jgi:hypothetical protein
MSISFFITPFDPALWEHGEPDPYPTSSLCIDPEEYSSKILQYFPASRRLDLEKWNWSLDDPTGPGAYVLLHQDRQTVSFSLGKNFLEFIIWHRDIIEYDHDLYLFNSSSWDSLLLTKNTTHEDVRQFTGMKNILKDSPLDGRWEGLLKLTEGQVPSRTYQCILSLAHYEDEINGEFVVTKHPPSGGTLISFIIGESEPISGTTTFQLHEERVVDHGSGVNPSFIVTKQLHITYIEGDPPHINGVFRDLGNKEPSVLGEIEVIWKPYKAP